MKANSVKCSLLSAAVIAGLGTSAAMNLFDATGIGLSRSASRSGSSAVPISVPGRISSLETIEVEVRKKYPTISHILPPDYNSLLDRSGRDDVILLDVRESEEFAVSHIVGALRVDPDASLETILATAGSVAGKSVVFYCSVGARSAKLAQRMQQRLTGLGAVLVANLSGGIFRWHNEDRGLVDGRGPTRLVHGYSAYWGQLVRRKELISREPQSECPVGRGDSSPATPF